MKKDMQKLRGGEVIANAPARTLDADEMARALQQIPAAEREKLYYMIKGYSAYGRTTRTRGAGGLIMKKAPIQLDEAFAIKNAFFPTFDVNYLFAEAGPDNRAG